MPRRKRRSPSNEAIEAIKQSLKNGVALTAEQEAEFEAFRSRVRLFDRPEGEVFTKTEWDGTVRFRVEGKKGIGTLQTPRGVADAERERRFLTDLAKKTRLPPGAKAVAARQAKSEVLVQRIEALLQQYEHLGRGAAKAVAAELDVTAEYVRRVRKRLQNKPD